MTYSAPHTEVNSRNNPRSRYATRLRGTLGMAVVLLVGVLLVAASARPDRGKAAAAGGTGNGYVALGNSSEGALPAWGADHVVNPAPVLTPSAMRNSAVAGNPVDPQKLIAGYENSGVKLNETDYASSSDAGRTWVTGAFTASWGMRKYIPFGDVNVAYDGRGTGYFTTLAISNTASLLTVLTTTDGLHWGSPGIIAFSPYTEYRSITSLAVDQRTSGADAGSAYLFYFLTDVNQKPMQRGVWMRASRDEGSSWSVGDTQVSDSNHLFSSYPDSVVAPDGTVYASWEYLPGNSIFSAHELYLDRSTDGGRSWGPDNLISGAPIVYAGGPDSKQKELVFVQTDTCQYVRLRNRPSIGVSPTDSNVVYAAWNDGRWESAFSVCGTQGQHSDIAFSRSIDGGLTWSAPIRVNDDQVGDGAEQFEPTMAVAGDGTVGLTWYDQRYNQAHNRYNLVYSQSTDGGNTWSATTQVSDTESNPDEVRDAKQIDDIGFRKALFFGQGYAIASWLDTRLGSRQGDFFVDNAPVATNSPTATPTASTT
ncbi:MAG: sialidase family protein, partial [Chloroflexota bacterium]